MKHSLFSLLQAYLCPPAQKPPINICMLYICIYIIYICIYICTYIYTYIYTYIDNIYIYIYVPEIGKTWRWKLISYSHGNFSAKASYRFRYRDCRKKNPGKGLQFLKKEGILINRVKRVGKTHKLIQLWCSWDCLTLPSFFSNFFTQTYTHASWKDPNN